MEQKVVNDVGHNLKRLRKLLGLSQRELAKLSGVSQQSISLYESADRNPRYEAVVAISETLGCRPCDIDPRLSDSSTPTDGNRPLSPQQRFAIEHIEMLTTGEVEELSSRLFFRLLQESDNLNLPSIRPIISRVCDAVISGGACRFCATTREPIS